MFASRTVFAVVLFLASVAADAADQAPSPAASEQVIKVTAKRFEYLPSVITVKRGMPVVLELTTADRVHGFEIPDLKLQAEIKPGEVSRVRFIPDKVGTFAFHCNIFCGSGHEDMAGQIVVTD